MAERSRDRNQDHMPPANYSVCISVAAIILAFYTIGPVLGFGSGALFLGMYVTLGGMLICRIYKAAYINFEHVHYLKKKKYFVRGGRWVCGSKLTFLNLTEDVFFTWHYFVGITAKCTLNVLKTFYQR